MRRVSIFQASYRCFLRRYASLIRPFVEYAVALGYMPPSFDLSLTTHPNVLSKKAWAAKTATGKGEAATAGGRVGPGTDCEEEGVDRQAPEGVGVGSKGNVQAEVDGHHVTGLTGALAAAAQVTSRDKSRLVASHLPLWVSQRIFGKDQPKMAGKIVSNDEVGDGVADAGVDDIQRSSTSTGDVVDGNAMSEGHDVISGGAGAEGAVSTADTSRKSGDMDEGGDETTTGSASASGSTSTSAGVASSAPCDKAPADDPSTGTATVTGEPAALSGGGGADTSASTVTAADAAAMESVASAGSDVVVTA